MASLTLDTITKSFGQLEILHGIDLDIADGEFVVFVGPSGCGKSTLLRVIAGLEPATGGTIAIDGEDVTHHSAAARGLAMVFQSYALYPHMSVYDNLAFGLENMRMPKDQITQRVQTAATLLQIDKLLQRKPGQLSGGQRQRVAIGRAITRNPKIFLFDEPLSNLDAELRVQMRIELSKLHKDLKATMIYVTHDQVEAMTMADKIVVLRDGRIEQIGKPLDLYNHPANKFVAGFIGSPRMNFISARVTACSANHVSVTASGLQETILPVNGTGLAQGDTVSLGIRPEHLELDAAGEWTLTVDVVEQLGGTSFIHGTLPSSESLSIAVNGQTGVSHGQPIRIRPKPGMVHLFSTTEGERALPPSSQSL